MRKYRFYKDELGWFIDLKWFPFSRAYLAMVCGADELLDKLSKGGNEIYISVTTKRTRDYTDMIIRTGKLGLKNGAIYKPLLTRLENHGFGKNRLWLCPVTLWVFLRYPKKIYFKVH